MQLLIRFDTQDRAAFREAYDAAREDRDQAGLTQLQLWEEAENPERVWALYGVSDEDKARGWLTRTAALAPHVREVERHFLATATAP